MTDFDKAPPMPVDRYRDSQHVIPGLDDLYRSIMSILATRLTSGQRVLVVGAGGGREIEAMVRSPLSLDVTGVDPSADMLELARTFVPETASDRVHLLQGVTADLPASPLFAAATAVLVMHFLPDGGAKAGFLSEIRSRLEPGAPYLHVDVALASDRELERLAPAVAHRARSIGLPDSVAEGAPNFVARMRSGDSQTIIDEPRTRELLGQAGFEVVSMFWAGFWYRGWWAEAV